MIEYKLSIIVPTYNSENEIEDTFNSIKNQTLGFDDIELIFVDDNSTDSTFRIITEYSDAYENVKAFKTDANSKFAGKPRNIGLDKSTSKYVLFLDSDDRLLVNSCEILLNNITSNGADISIGAQINYYDNDVQEHIPPLYTGRNEIFENGNDMNLLSITPAISAKLFSKKLLITKKIRFAEGIPGQDLLFLTEVLLNSSKINVLNNNYIYYRQIHDKSVSLNPNEDYIYGLIKVYTLLCDLFEKFSIDIDVQLAILQRHLGFLSMQILRAYNNGKITTEEWIEIFNSRQYTDLTDKSLFKNNNEFGEFFKFLKERDYKTARTKINSIDLKFNTINDYSNLKNEINDLEKQNKIIANDNISLKKQNDRLTEQNNNLNNEFVDLKHAYEDIKVENEEMTNSNNYLKEENSNLKSELDEIKSSRIWKIKNKFN